MVGVRPVVSGHGSYQYVRYGGRQFGGTIWGSARAATMANAATIVAATAIHMSQWLNGPHDDLIPRDDDRRGVGAGPRGHHGAWATLTPDITTPHTLV